MAADTATPAGPRPAPDPLTRALGWTSAALGLPLLAPARVAQAVGVGEQVQHRALAAAVGARELVSAAGLLGGRSPGWLWSRVGGDAMDLTVLGRALANPGRRRLGRTVAATAAVAAITAVDVYAALTRGGRRSMQAHGTTTVATEPDAAYRCWRRLANLPLFLAHLEEVRETGGSRSHWRAVGPLGRSVEWDAEITEDVAAERLSWRSLAGADVANEGSVSFRPAPGGRGTEVHVELRYALPGGRAGAALARLFGADPHQALDDDLRRFKQVLETGEVVRSDGAPGGKRAGAEFPQRPARPLTADELAEVLS